VPNSANLRPIPFQKGNRFAERHGFYATVVTPVESDEIAEIANAIRELSPLEAEALEPLIQLVAGQMWRRRKAYADLEANGVVRARGKAAPSGPNETSLARSRTRIQIALLEVRNAVVFLNGRGAAAVIRLAPQPAPPSGRAPPGR
jgi:hypothetical protein